MVPAALAGRQAGRWYGLNCNSRGPRTRRCILRVKEAVAQITEQAARRREPGGLGPPTLHPWVCPYRPLLYGVQHQSSATYCGISGKLYSLSVPQFLLLSDEENIYAR